MLRVRNEQLKDKDKELDTKQKEIAKQSELLLEQAEAANEAATAQKKDWFKKKRSKAGKTTAKSKENKKPKKAKVTETQSQKEKPDDIGVAAMPGNNENNPTVVTNCNSASSKDHAEEMPEACEILSHKDPANEDNPVLLLVKWQIEKSQSWMKLYDMWADYKEEVIQYRNKVGLNRKKEMV